MSDYPSLEGLRVVLVEPSHPGNIGAVARAMKNMGVSELALVSPVSFPDEKASARASGADDVLANARVVSDLGEAVADCVEVIGASARSRSVTWPILNPRDCGSRALEQRLQGPVALVFGREDNGLSNEELRRCHYHVQVPANPDFSSLNLAMAVQVMLYEVRMQSLFDVSESPAPQWQSTHSPVDDGWDELPATAADMERLLAHLEQTLTTTGFHDPERPRQLMVRMRRLFQRAHPDRMEMNILRGILTSVDKLARSRNRGNHV
ncbi:MULTISPECIES: tRNA (cytosine(32)/uridine(32)-2'-O)-methyltransferase TrmJ [Halomonadaceae]|uniref:tRNA (cytidine/uridine-2'-O-)-methyltransferase TrmJ n=1 Tax=Vreelandella halophila TaxID=86177 RepID=A0A9X4YGA3_9GAMM|nr:MULTISPECIES: tRNA (cytosine(32)/uridine(32)-2'-O)-methyltransferase TrmJ [Halomonas]MYL27410.1 tRNA (cytosine(32)/uridine(32)-2'-O)-methyltransferase TrmJ [Halomonas utahensis]MYL74536.1 tRNA (cytosine(32)/uridine(32)-2'-O)-methyltransferase TrmJ [Halomonas sp. 22501_18_FS]